MTAVVEVGHIPSASAKSPVSLLSDLTSPCQSGMISPRRSARPAPLEPPYGLHRRPTDMTPVPIPSTSPLPSAIAPTSPAAVVIPDDRYINGLIDALIERSGEPQSVLAQRMGIKKQSLNQYKTQRRGRPSVQWLARLAAICGARLVLEFPTRPLEGRR